MGNEMDEKEVEKLEYPYLLTLEVGTIADRDSMARDDLHLVHIGSQIQPVKIGAYEDGDLENGVSESHEFWVIVQKGKPILIDWIEEGHNYGCEYMKNGGYRDFHAFQLPGISASFLALEEHEEPEEYEDIPLTDAYDELIEMHALPHE